MYQKLVTGLAGAMLCSVAAIASASTPATEPVTAEDAPNVISEQALQNHTLAHEMMGHISLAQVALDLNLPAEAWTQIQAAQELEDTLADQMPEVVLNSTFEFGKVIYNDKSTLRDHYIPVVNDTFLVSNFEDIYKNARTLDADVMSAGVKHVQVSVDLREVSNALDRASTAIGARDYETAASALNDVFRDAIIDEDEIDDPRLMIEENLTLTKAFIAQEQYDSARLTLKHVQNRLHQVESDKAATIDKASLDEFSTEIDEIQADLRMKDPSLLQRVSHRIDSWGDKIAGWFS